MMNGAMTMLTFTAVAHVDDVPPGTAKAVDVDGEQVQTNPDGTRIVLNSKDSGCGCLGL